jgi:hypothetical protein
MSEEHPQEDIAYNDPEFQKRLKIQQDNFDYGLMSMDDVELTNDVTDPEQDEADVVGTLKRLFGGKNG